MPTAEEQAPDFALPGTTGDIRLSDIYAAKKVVLAFYTEDNTPLCSSKISMLRDVIQDLGAEVIAISADTLESHRDFVQRLGGVPFPVLSDDRLEAARAYGAVDEAGKRSRRAVFVIDRGGRIIHTEPWFQPGNPAQSSTRRSSGLWGSKDDMIRLYV